MRAWQSRSRPMPPKVAVHIPASIPMSQLLELCGGWGAVGRSVNASRGRGRGAGARCKMRDAGARGARCASVQEACLQSDVGADDGGGGHGERIRPQEREVCVLEAACYDRWPDEKGAGRGVDDNVQVDSVRSVSPVDRPAEEDVSHRAASQGRH